MFLLCQQEHHPHQHRLLPIPHDSYQKPLVSFQLPLAKCHFPDKTEESFYWASELPGCEPEGQHRKYLEDLKSSLYHKNWQCHKYRMNAP